MSRNDAHDDVEAAASTASAGSPSFVWGVAPAEDDRFDADTPPRLRRDDEGGPATHAPTLSGAGPYRVWTLAVDASTGTASLASTTFGGSSGDPDDDGLTEDVNDDGRVDEADATALAHRVGNDEVSGADADSYDFDVDSDVDADDVRALFEQVDEVGGS
ncbi:hypothetical protein [Halorussus litoreus]|uniref:hypothetical protein n=1 Tax=Halorussus litoreus TaxID=1710536 RepID=UPI000E27CA4B|nr:hypothetical protein [Halorussus litoreus]